MVLISEFVGPPNVHLNTDPLKYPHYVGGGDRTEETPNRCHVLEKKGFFPLEELVI